jgi:two-component system nitrate/nitrite response regulator NarL
MFLSGLDGLEIIQQVQRRKLPTRILVLSGHSNGAIVYEALQAGASGFLSKDADPKTIQAALFAVLSGENYLPANLACELTAEIRLRSGNGVGTLTGREREVLVLSAKGQSAQQIALKMALSVSTIKTHLEHTYRKLNVPSRPAAIAEAMRRGLLQ